MWNPKIRLIPQSDFPAAKSVNTNCNWTIYFLHNPRQSDDTSTISPIHYSGSYLMIAIRPLVSTLKSSNSEFGCDTRAQVKR